MVNTRSQKNRTKTTYNDGPK